jgi:Protein of unknown function (DUF2865)
MPTVSPAPGTRRPDPRAGTAGAVAALATLGLVATSAAHHTAGDAPDPAEAAAIVRPAAPAARPRLRLAETGASWPLSFFEGLFGIPPRSEPRPRRPPSTYRRAPQREPPRQPAPPPAPARQEQSHPDQSGTYRTLCVRLCDGYYWPISFATGEDAFERDSKACARSCEQPAALYYHANPGGEPEQMVSLDGKPYTNLRTAFLYRTVYDPACKCRPHPWEAEAIERHRRYAQPKQRRAAGR